MLDSAVSFSHAVMQSYVGAGDAVVDATAGNGNDTEFLARMVGASGRVYAFDVQREALERTRRRLADCELLQRVTLIETGHECLAEHVEGRELAALMFNLGYLPGSDRTVITQPETTVSALRQGISLLRPGGVVTVVMYPGHRGGEVEKEAVMDFCARLDDGTYLAHHMHPLNSSCRAPSTVTIHRKSQ